MSALAELEHAPLDTDSRGVLRFITAGSVDDGKSTLIGRLLHDSHQVLEDQLASVSRASAKKGIDSIDLSLFTDGLEAEREQGITIDVAYRYFATARRKFIIADTPGHEQYTRNMVTGASTADAAIILVDARKGVLAQTRRHACIAHLLGVKHILVAVNKMDLVDYDRAAFDRIRADFLAFAARLDIGGLRFFPVSALAGDMVVERGARLGWHDGPTLLQALETCEVHDEARAAPLRFPVQLVVRPGGGTDFRGYAGRVAAGMVRVGDAVLVQPAGRRTRVRQIVSLDRVLPVAVAGDSVTLLLEDEIDISRGDLIAHVHDAPAAHKNISATVCWLATADLDPTARYALKHTSRTVKAKIAAIDSRLDIHTLSRQAAPATLTMNDIARVRLALAQPLYADPYALNRTTGAFILIDELSNQTVAAGMIET